MALPNIICSKCNKPLTPLRGSQGVYTESYYEGGVPDPYITIKAEIRFVCTNCDEDHLVELKSGQIDEIIYRYYEGGKRI